MPDSTVLAKKRLQLFKDGFYCSEAIIQVFNEHLDLGLTENAIRMATGFGAGLGVAKCCCGSLTRSGDGAEAR